MTSDAKIEGADEVVTEHSFSHSAVEMEKLISFIEAHENLEVGV